MKTITLWTHYYERTNQHEKSTAYIVDELPSVGDHVSFIYDDEIVDSVWPAYIDCEQPSRDVWDYEYFTLEIRDAENEEDIDWIIVAVERGELSHDC